jgi:hypothetical protein
MVWVLVCSPTSDAIARAQEILTATEAPFQQPVTERSRLAFEALEPAFAEYSNVCGGRRSAVTRPRPICRELINEAKLQPSGPLQNPGAYGLILSSGDFPIVVLAALRIAQVHAIARFSIMCIRLPKVDFEQMQIYRAELDNVSFPFLEIAESLLADIDRAVEGSSVELEAQGETAAARQMLLGAELCAIESRGRAMAR